jgi:type IV pilus assembly protein PilA
MAAVIVTVGLVVALGWRWNTRVQARMQDSAAISNLRQLQAGADQYFYEHPGVTSVASAVIVGTNSTQYVRSWATIAQETYSPAIVQGHGIAAIGIAGARTVTYGP